MSITHLIMSLWRRTSAMKTVSRITLLLIVALTAGSQPAWGQRNLTDIPDPDPEFERQTLEVADGFEINLYAADPLLAKPIQINFDPQGRLWVATSETYPHIEPGQAANDKIIILEDQDRDGRADKTTIFAEGLLIPTGVEPGDGGAYVANSTQLLHMRDTNGDGRADTSEIVLSGFGTEDTHHILHTFRWGPDGMLYFNQSIYIHSHIETPHGVRRLNGGGIWRFRPETLELDVFMRGLVNTWGHDFDDWGQSFATDGAGGEGINYIVPGAGYFTAVDMPRILAGLNPGSPKHCGLEIVGGRHLPDDWQGNLITNDFRANRVCRFVPSDDGSGFSSREMPELVKSNNVAFRPVDVKQGPDGAIYIADWYNPIIQHGEVDFRDPRRDHVHGRIWRISRKDRPALEYPQLVEASTEGLLEQLHSPEPYTRRHAKRVLKERGAEILPALELWVAGLDPSDEQGLLEGLWTYQSLDVVQPDLLAKLLRADNPAARAAATRAAGLWQSRLNSPIKLLAAQVTDENPRVRLEAVRALAAVGTTEAFITAMQALDYPQDRFLDYALWLTARDLQPAWLPALQSGELTSVNPRHLEFAFQAVGSPAVVEPVLELIDNGSVPADRREALLKIVATLGTAEQLGRVLNTALDADALTSDARARLLEDLVQTARRRELQPTADLTQVALLLSAETPEPLRAAAARAVGQWQLADQRPVLEELALSAELPLSVRRAAMEGLVALGGEETVAHLLKVSGEAEEPAVRQVAVETLISLAPRRAARAGVTLLTEGTHADAGQLVAAFLQRQQGADSLATALAEAKISADDAKLGLRALDSSAQVHDDLRAALNSAGGLSETGWEFTPEQIAEFVSEVASRGNPARGEEIYRRDQLACLKCHAIGGSGGRVGPDLVSIGASAPVDYLLESLVLPNAKVKENYHSQIVATDDGRVFTGIVVGQTDRELLLRDAEDRQVAIDLESIDDRADGGSIMPAGLVNPLTRDELLDLVAFLSQLGKPGPYAVDQQLRIRTWEVLDPTAEVAAQLLALGSELLTADSPLAWRSEYSTVGGELPLANLPQVELADQSGPRTVLRCGLDVTQPGLGALGLSHPSGVQALVNGQPVADLAAIELPAGEVTITLLVDRSLAETDRFAATLQLPEGTTARARPIGGKTPRLSE